MFDEIELDSLPQSKEEAFVLYEKLVRKEYEKQSQNDRSFHANHNGEYFGSYAPEKAYVMAILAFIDEYGLEISLPNIIELSGGEFEAKFGNFKSETLYAAMRFSLRKKRIDNGSIGTLLTINKDYKSDIAKSLDTIRKIVNQEVTDIKKRDKIFSKIAALQSEIDREHTTVDSLFGRMIDLSKTIGECANNIEPLIDKLERIKKLFWESSEKVELLPKAERQKLITTKQEPEVDDDIPF